MPGDSIFSDTDENPAGDQDVTLTAEQAKAIEDNNKEQNTKIETLNAQLKESNDKLTVAQTPKPAPKPSPTGSVTSEESLSLLVEDPAGYMAKAADGRISVAISEQLAPMLAPVVAATHKGILDSERTAHDIEFGLGNFEELIMPELQKNFEELTVNNSNALSDPTVVKALVSNIRGTKRSELNKAEETLAKTQQDAKAAETANIVSQLPASIRPKNKDSATELPEGTDEFFDRVARATGERPDKDSFLAVHNAGEGITGYTDAMSKLKEARS